MQLQRQFNKVKWFVAPDCIKTEELTRGTATQEGEQTNILKNNNYLQVDFIKTKIIITKKICVQSLIKYSPAQNRHKTTAEFPLRDFDPYWW